MSLVEARALSEPLELDDIRREPLVVVHRERPVLRPGISLRIGEVELLGELLEEDIRWSWTLFMAGGLFRFRDAGFTTEADLLRRSRDASATEDQRQEAGKCLRKFKLLQPRLLEERMSMHMSLQGLADYYGTHLV